MAGNELPAEASSREVQRHFSDGEEAGVDAREFSRCSQPHLDAWQGFWNQPSLRGFGCFSTLGGANSERQWAGMVVLHQFLHIVVSERVAFLRLRVGGQILSVVWACGLNSSSAYPPFLEFLGVLECAFSSLVLYGDFNAHVGGYSETWRGLIG